MIKLFPLLPNRLLKMSELAPKCIISNKEKKYKLKQSIKPEKSPLLFELTHL